MLPSSFYLFLFQCIPNTSGVSSASSLPWHSYYFFFKVRSSWTTNSPTREFLGVKVLALGREFYPAVFGSLSSMAWGKTFHKVDFPDNWGLFLLSIQILFILHRQSMLSWHIIPETIDIRLQKERHVYMTRFLRNHNPTMSPVSY